MKKSSFNCKTLLLVSSLILSNGSFAAIKKHKHVKTYVPIKSNLVIDGNSGRVLYKENENKKIYPASLTKVMTIYIAFDAIKAGKIKLSDNIKVSKKAANMSPCKLGLKEGENITVKDAIFSLIVKSANDSAVALAEHIAGSEDKFSVLMNKKAKLIGMKNTKFRNASGWHNDDQFTTAMDLGKLAISLKKNHPNFYPWFSRTEFVYKGNQIFGHNRVTKNYFGAEGMKTGYTSKAGYNLITTAKRDNKSLVAISLGNPTSAIRDAKIVSMLDNNFLKLGSKVYASSNNKISQSYNKSNNSSIDSSTDNNFYAGHQISSIIEKESSQKTIFNLVSQKVMEEKSKTKMGNTAFDNKFASIDENDNLYSDTIENDNQDIKADSNLNNSKNASNTTSKIVTKVKPAVKKSTTVAKASIKKQNLKAKNIALNKTSKNNKLSVSKKTSQKAKILANKKLTSKNVKLAAKKKILPKSKIVAKNKKNSMKKIKLSSN